MPLALLRAGCKDGKGEEGLGDKVEHVDKELSILEGQNKLVDGNHKV